MKSASRNDCVLQPPVNKEIIDTKTSILWFDEGILYSIAKKKPRTLEDIKDSIKTLKNIIGTKKVCLITDTTNTQAYSMEMREELTRELSKLFKAIAILPCSPVGEMIGAIIFMGQDKVPSMMFDKVEEAKEWIGQYTK
jgi:hypothetical protein